MPSLAQLRAKTAANPNSVSNGGTPAPTITPENLVQIPAAAPLDLPVPMPQRGVFPPQYVFVSDRSDSTRVFRGPNTRSAIFQTQTQPTAAAIAAAITPTAVTAAIEILVNNQPTASQKILNFLNSTTVQFTSGANGQISATAAAALGDGISHGQTVVSPGTWESDPAYYELREDFDKYTSGSPSGTINQEAIGQGWIVLPTSGGIPTQAGIVGGGFPNSGYVFWENNTVASACGLLGLNTFQSIDQAGGMLADGGWPLFDYPGWQATWIWRVETPRNCTSRSFATTQKSLYVGLMGSAASATVSTPNSRPDLFFGVRYDTSTTSPSINDSFFTLEAVQNPTFSGGTRNNTQGTTLVTSIAPAVGTWHRLDIYCSAAGVIKIVLDNSNVLTVNVSVMTVSPGAGSLSGTQLNGAAQISYSPSPTVGTAPWAPGSIVTVSGFTTTHAVLNGTRPLIKSVGSSLSSASLNFDIPGNSGTGNATGSVSGYPALVPGVMYGNDDTASPTSNTMQINVDFFSFLWNPKLLASGGPVADPTLSRYF